MIRNITRDDEEEYTQMVQDFYSSDAVAHSLNPKNIKNTLNEALRDDTYVECFILEQSSKTTEKKSSTNNENSKTTYENSFTDEKSLTNEENPNDEEINSLTNEENPENTYINSLTKDGTPENSDKYKVTAGYAVLAKTFSQEAGGMVIWIEELYIKPEYRAKGIGKEFFKYVHEKYKEAKRFRLELTPENKIAREIYEHLGYEDLAYKQMTMDF